MNIENVTLKDKPSKNNQPLWCLLWFSKSTVVSKVLICSELKFVLLHEIQLIIWPFSSILAWWSTGSRRLGLLHAPATIKYYSVFDRVTNPWNCWVWKGPLEIKFSHLPPQSRVSYCRFVWAKSNQVFKMSWGGDSTASVGTIFQCLTTFTVNKVFFYF